MTLLNLAHWIVIASIISYGSSTPSSNTKVAVRAKPVDGCTLKKSPPSSAICGQAGQLTVTSTSSNVTIAPQILSFQKCRDWCFHQQVCTYFALDSQSGLCNFYIAPSPSNVSFQPNPSSTNKVYQLSCFNCNQVCPFPQGFNLIDNGGFETSGQYYGPWGELPGARVVSPGDSSKRAITFEGQLTTIRHWCPGQQYLYQLDVKIVKLQPKANPGLSYPVSLGLYAGDASVLHGYHINDTYFGSWHTLQFSFQAPPENKSAPSLDSITVNFDSDVYHNKPIFQVYVDNVIVKPVQPSYQTVGDSLLVNGGFETGNYSSWTVGADTLMPEFKVISTGLSDSDGAAPSNYAFYYKGMYFYYDYYPYFEGYEGQFHISQYLSTNTTAGESYIVSFEYRVYNVGGMIVSLGEYQWEEQLGNASTKPRGFSRIFQGSGGSDSLELLFYGPGDDDTNHEQIVELDNFSIYQLANDT